MEEEQKAKMLYCNVFSAIVSPYDFVFDFGQKSPEQAKSGNEDYDVQARIVMSPEHVKAMLSMIAGLLDNYEEKFGEIPTSK